MTTPFHNPQVAAHFAAYPAAVRKKMLSLRELIFDVAVQSPEIGELEEALKWGEPAYLTAQTKSGSTIRIDWKAKSPEQLAVYFNCNTNLVESFKSLFPNDFQFEGQRALLMKVKYPLPKKELSFCISAALLYHTKKKIG
jgi:Domain of unknown function (DU1801)